LVINKKSGVPSAFIDHVEATGKFFALHRMVVKNQVSALNSVGKDLLPGELFANRDFSEKQKLKPPEEIQR
jgi:hypothetical protein